MRISIKSMDRHYTCFCSLLSIQRLDSSWTVVIKMVKNMNCWPINTKNIGREWQNVSGAYATIIWDWWRNAPCQWEFYFSIFVDLLFHAFISLAKIWAWISLKCLIWKSINITGNNYCIQFLEILTILWNYEVMKKLKT